ncbi:MAG: twin transmembrane helix small protein [Alphaproteobacteria bacterium]|nr:twin transmembrane helix small protein [Alphaproteobacteria bacterium]MCZ6510555.1 twin transmembrane helix small protein [Alphaproteobacteria bacterium]MCZ6591251.1 twin transmembrane helix small protein [Alphaproteobacteria bacterium]MCZ6839845.1 twin transmembrane helix small protein [Alphaproteobacteria bacterium]
MNTVIIILLAVTLAAVVIVLITGVVGMARGGDFNAKYGNKLMRWRVLLQGLAIVLFLLFVVTASRG